MIPVSQATQDAIQDTHQPRWDVYLTPLSGPVVHAEPLEGSVFKDSTQYPRTQFRVRVPTEISPVVASDQFLPFGTRCRIDWTLNGETITVAEGPVVQSVLSRPEGTWRLECMDDTALLEQDLVAFNEFTFVNGETVADFIDRLVSRTLPGTTFAFSGEVLTDTVDTDLKPADDDPPFRPWQVIESACSSSGAEAWLRPDGVMVIQDIPDLGTPVDTLSAEKDITGYRISHERAVNRTVIEFANRDGVHLVTGSWEDTRANSPLNVNNVGRVTYAKVHRSSVTQGRADRAARQLARKVAGRARVVEFEAIAHPWLEPGDTITVEYRDGSTENHLITSVDIPLSAEAMRIQCRDSRYKSNLPV